MTAVLRKIQPQAGVFGLWQPLYAEHGIPTFPVRFVKGDKKPTVSNYLGMGLRSSQALVDRFGDSMAIGFALKRARITVLDVDSPDERVLADAIAHHGETPLIIRTQSGNWQAWYRHAGERRAIRPFGADVPIDILGDGYVVAPPSQGAKGLYAIVQGSLDDLDRLPLMCGLVSNDNVERSTESGSRIALGNRNKALLYHCLRHAHHCDEIENLRDVANTFAEQSLDRADGHPFTDSEVEGIVQWVWGKTEAGENWHGRGGSFALEHAIVDLLAASDPYAFALFSILNRHHGGAEEFILASAMAESLGWDLRRFKAARKKLVEYSLIRCIHPGGNGPSDPPIYGWAEGVRKCTPILNKNPSLLVPLRP